MSKKIKTIADMEDLKDMLEGDAGIVPLLSEQDSVNMMDVELPAMLPIFYYPSVYRAVYSQRHKGGV